MKAYYLLNSIGSAFRLIISCLINGQVYEETDKMLLSLEDIHQSVLATDEKHFRELMAVRTLNMNLPNGFTIAGLMPLRKATLLSVFDLV